MSDDKKPDPLTSNQKRVVGRGQYFMRFILPDLLDRRPDLVESLVNDAMSYDDLRVETLRHIEKLMENGRMPKR
jgi:hypothetical protein